MRSVMIALLVLAGLVAAQDPDRDGLPTPVERALGTDPLAADSDGDGIPDGTEAVAVAPKGDPRDPRVRLDGPGVRGFVWRDGDTATLYVVVRVAAVESPVVQVLVPGSGLVSLLPLLRLETVGQDGTVTIAVSWPAALLQAAGGQLPFRVSVGALRWSGTLLEHGGRWYVLEATSGGTRRVPAEEASVAPFPSASHYGLRTCGQTLRRTGPAGEPGYGWYEVSREDCSLNGPECVLDCGTITGVRAIMLDRVGA